MTIAEKQLFDPVPALEERSSAVDIQVRKAWQEHLAVAVRAGAALLAVGGYGRRQLFPYSDIDLLLLFASDKTATGLKDAISRFLQQLWDAGLRVSQSVRTPAECLELHDDNIELNVSLLDQRYLAGDAVVYGALLAKLPRFVHGQRDALVRHLSRMTRDRHASFNGTLYHLEPNIKESPGGLRDLQLVSWLAQIAGTTPQSLAAPPPTPDLDEARHFLFGLRGYLHQHAKRDSNVLTFDAQEWVAEQTGTREPDALMRDYFRNARTVHRSALRVLETEEARASSLFAQFRDRRARVSNADFTVSRERVFFRSPAELDTQPELLLRLLQFVARHGVRLSFEAEQRIAARLPALRSYFASPRPIWPAVREALSLPHAPMALRATHEAGALTALFPEMEQIDCLVIRDFYHRYTVDEHTLVAIQTLVQLRDAKDPSTRPYGGLLLEIEQPGLLVFALLFHDVGKSNPEEGHVDASLRFAERAMERIEMPEAERETVRFVIRCHLEMSATMNGRDPFDPATAEYLAHKVGTVERLKHLTLVTYADISAVNPSAMTSWRAEQLWQLYLLTYNELTRELETERIERADSPERSAFLKGFPTRYLHTHTAAEIERHMQLELDGREQRGRRRDRKNWQRIPPHAGHWRPPIPVRVGSRHALQFRHEHFESRGVRQPARHGAGHVFVHRSRAHAGAESDRGGPAESHGGTRRAGPRRRQAVAAQPAAPGAAQPQGAHHTIGFGRRRGLGIRHADSSGGRGPAGAAVRHCIHDLLATGEHRGCAHRYGSAQSDRCVLRDGERAEARRRKAA